MPRAGKQNAEKERSNNSKQPKPGKRGAESPAEGEDKDIKRINQAGCDSDLEHLEKHSGAEPRDMEVGNMENMEGAIIEIAARVGDCVNAQEDTIPTLNAHSDLIYKSNEEIKELKKENLFLNKRQDTLDAAQKCAKEKLQEVESTANANSQMLKNANIVIEGIIEDKEEDCRSIAGEIFKEIEGKIGQGEIISAYLLVMQTLITHTRAQ